MNKKVFYHESWVDKDEMLTKPTLLEGTAFYYVVHQIMHIQKFINEWIQYIYLCFNCVSIYSISSNSTVLGMQILHTTMRGPMYYYVCSNFFKGFCISLSNALWKFRRGLPFYKITPISYPLFQNQSISIPSTSLFGTLKLATLF